MVQEHERVTANAICCEFDSHSRYSFLRSGVASKRDIEFRYLPRSASRIGEKWGAEF